MLLPVRMHQCESVRSRGVNNIKNVAEHLHLPHRFVELRKTAYSHTSLRAPVSGAVLTADLQQILVEIGNPILEAFTQELLLSFKYFLPIVVILLLRFGRMD